MALGASNTNIQTPRWHSFYSHNTESKKNPKQFWYFFLLQSWEIANRKFKPIRFRAQSCSSLRLCNTYPSFAATSTSEVSESNHCLCITLSYCESFIKDGHFFFFTTNAKLSFSSRLSSGHKHSLHSATCPSRWSLQGQRRWCLALEPAQLNRRGSTWRQHSPCSVEKAGKRWFISDSTPSHWKPSLKYENRGWEQCN